eukprot:COSAG05_NODE_707_length_7848_cov_6.252420_6_plen_52_part_00
MDCSMDGWTDGRLNGRMDGWMDGLLHGVDIPLDDVMPASPFKRKAPYISIP